jgi:hypothetical protein
LDAQIGIPGGDEVGDVAPADLILRICRDAGISGD